MGSTEVPLSLAPYDYNPVQPNDFTRRAIDRLRPIKVIVLGGGMSGIIAGILFPRSIENLELVIYEKNPELGGTWYESRYPGVACDIPSHAYQFTFESNPRWSSYYVGGAEILEYLKNVANKYDATKYMRFNHHVQDAVWDDNKGQWTVHITKTDTGEQVIDTADVVISAVGTLNAWKWPSLPGLDLFKGPKMHSANWKENFEVDGKTVALIGGGSSGIQILPQIQPKAAHIHHYMKGKTWIPPVGFGGQALIERGGDPMTPAEDLKRFEADPKAYLEYRHYVEGILHTASDALYKGTDNALAFQQACYEHMKSKLAKKPEIFKSLLPDFSPACRRLTPGPGYLEALVQDNVDFISTGIEEIKEDGILTQDGKFWQCDAIICATGFVGYKQTFPVYGMNGVNLQDVWNNGIPEAYLAMAPEDMPNYYLFLGPNGGPGVGSTVPFLENQAAYMINCIKKIQREWIKTMVPRRSAVKAFGRYADRFFEPTVFNSTCRAWWRHQGDGRILAVWPGSQLHGMYAWQNPRWEDYEYETKEELEGNMLGWLGNGYVRSQIEGGRTTGYLDTAGVPVENPIELKKVAALAPMTAF